MRILNENDMETIVSKIKKLPPGQIKKALSEDVITILKKYGLDFKDNKE